MRIPSGYDNFTGTGAGNGAGTGTGAGGGQYDETSVYGAYDGYGGGMGVGKKYGFDADESMRNLDSLGGVYTSLGASSATTSTMSPTAFRMDYGGMNSSELGKIRNTYYITEHTTCSSQHKSCFKQFT